MFLLYYEFIIGKFYMCQSNFPNTIQNIARFRWFLSNRRGYACSYYRPAVSTLTKYLIRKPFTYREVWIMDLMPRARLLCMPGPGALIREPHEALHIDFDETS